MKILVRGIDLIKEKNDINELVKELRKANTNEEKIELQVAIYNARKEYEEHKNKVAEIAIEKEYAKEQDEHKVQKENDYCLSM